MRIVCILVGAVAWTGCSSSKYGELTVQTVSAQWPGSPLQGIRVQVDESAWATTDAQGKATFPNVGRPFTVRTYMTFQGTLQFHKVGEIAGADANPMVVPLNNQHFEANVASFAGVVANRSGGARSRLQVIAAHPGGFWRAKVAADGTFHVETHWEGASWDAWVLHAFESDGADPPTHYFGYGSLTVPVSDGAAVSGLTVALAPVAEMHVAGHVALSGALSGGTLLRSMMFELADHSFLSLFPGGLGVTSAGPFDCVVPVLGPAVTLTHYWIGNTAAEAGDRQRVDLAGGVGTNGVPFELGAPVTLLAPAEGATTGPGTLFRWSAGPQGASYHLEMSCQDGQGGFNPRGLDWEIRTTATEARLVGVPFFTPVSGATCGWEVRWDAFPPSMALFSPGKWSTTETRTATAR
jgi:hypothetical protein